MFYSFSKKYLYPQKEDNVIWYCGKALYRRYVDDNLSQVGGQLAYFFILSIFPLLMLISQIIGRFNLRSSEVSFIIKDFIPPNILEIALDYISFVNKTTSTGIFTFSALFSVYLASKAITSLIYALNKAYRIDIHTTNFQKKILAFIVTLFVILAVIISLILITLGKPLMLKISTLIGLEFIFLETWSLIRWGVATSALFITLFIIYNIIPFKTFPRKYNIAGTLFTMVSWSILSLAFAYYVNNISNYSKIYGSLGTVMLMLLYLYFAGIIIVLGGELNHILAQRSIGNFEYDVKNF